jgi:hypothetical protein
MKIPTEFKLFGLTIAIEYDAALFRERKEFGVALLDKETIVLQTLDDSQLTQPQQEQTFCHEWVHHILDKMGEDKLCNNEKFVDIFSQLLYQSIVTMKYPEK